MTSPELLQRLKSLGELRNSGAISDDEFAAQKSDLLSRAADEAERVEAEEKSRLPAGTVRLGMGLAGAGGAMMLVGAFLPQWDAASVDFGAIEGNSVLQAGTGFIYLILLAIAAFMAVTCLRSRQSTYGVMVAGLLALLYTPFAATGDNMKLCASATGHACQHASPGIGIFVVGIGAALVTVGGWTLRGKSGDTI